MMICKFLDAVVGCSKPKSGCTLPDIAFLLFEFACEFGFCSKIAQDGESELWCGGLKCNWKCLVSGALQAGS